MSEGIHYGFDQIPHSVREQAAAELKKNPELEEILNSTSAMDVRAKILQHYRINPAHKVSNLHSAILAEAVNLWNKRQIEKSAE